VVRPLLTAALLLPMGWAHAQGESQGTLRLIVPFTPGTGIDLIARTLGPKLSERLKRPVMVENRVGGFRQHRHGGGGSRGARRQHLAGERQYAGDEPQSLPQHDI
jgi:tripartite-type tricarboxylate transporter receptor subunit TctC